MGHKETYSLVQSLSGLPRDQKYTQRVSTMFLNDLWIKQDSYVSIYSFLEMVILRMCVHRRKDGPY